MEPQWQGIDLQGKTALVTGARTGIGQAVAIALANAGARIILHGHGGAMGESEALLPLDRHLATVNVDLSDREAASAWDSVLDAWPVDILVNNAGIIHRQPFLEHEKEPWDDVLQVNLTAVFALSQKVARQMSQRGGGKIIHIASLLSFQGGINVVGYAASKHALVGLTQAMANDLAGYGIQVNAIAPGYIQTNNTEALSRDPVRSEQILARIPARRWGRPEDIAGAALFLASDLSNYVTGHTLVVDGGWMGR